MNNKGINKENKPRLSLALALLKGGFSLALALLKPC